MLQTARQAGVFVVSQRWLVVQTLQINLRNGKDLKDLRAIAMTRHPVTLNSAALHSPMNFANFQGVMS
jgi:uncharacterized protein YvpB